MNKLKKLFLILTVITAIASVWMVAFNYDIEGGICASLSLLSWVLFITIDI